MQLVSDRVKHCNSVKDIYSIQLGNCGIKNSAQIVHSIFYFLDYQSTGQKNKLFEFKRSKNHQPSGDKVATPRPPAGFSHVEILPARWSIMRPVHSSAGGLIDQHDKDRFYLCANPRKYRKKVLVQYWWFQVLCWDSTLIFGSLLAGRDTMRSIQKCYPSINE